MVGLLTLLWVGGLLALASYWFAIGMEQWAASYSPEGEETANLRRRASEAMLATLLLAAAGPPLIAAVAYGMRLVRTAIVFLVLAVVLGVPALTLAAYTYRDLDPPPPAPAPVTGCRELSGGDTRCPGG
ncbi:DUF6234 family protein [Micromonospora okii]|uniref:DUF6234 family protein n=1 Tax=Micromonospora okii TaxID=1182970 RepID=UPI001E40842E|nr:DUF6234 family protein [Micromonospora okii]